VPDAGLLPDRTVYTALMCERFMNKFENFILIATLAFLALLVSSPVRAQAPAYNSCPPGSETLDDHCPVQPPDMMEAHPPMIELVEAVKRELYGDGPVPGDCQGGWSADCATDCGAGRITEEVAACIPGARVIHKTWGAGCSSHSFDVIVFPDGYYYDIIGSAGQSNLPTWQALCCENLPPDPPTGDGTCPGRWANSDPPSGACIVPDYAP
jgi:hypothetical protein